MALHAISAVRQAFRDITTRKVAAPKAHVYSAKTTRKESDTGEKKGKMDPGTFRQRGKGLL